MASDRKRGNAGNSMQDELDFQRSMAQVGLTLARFARIDEALADRGLVLTGIRIRLPNEGSGEFLGVVSANAEGRRVVGFVSGGTLPDVLLNLVRRLEHGDLQWRDDKYAGS